jgi:hypothetical protein
MRNNLPPLTMYDWFTGGNTKTADLAIYYNVALDGIQKVQKSISTLPKGSRIAFLTEYLWKAHILSKNSNGYEIRREDEGIIGKLIAKLEAIRNYHSHIWHDNSVLAFDKDLKKFVQNRYNEAKAALFKEYPSSLVDYEKAEKERKFSLFNFVKEKGQHFISVEGRIFFLSFFLSTGQMNYLLQQRKGFKRIDMPLFKMKRLLYVFYCHRDGAAFGNINYEARFIDEMEPEDRQNIYKARNAFKLISYLCDYPAYWGNIKYTPLLDKHDTLINNVHQLKEYIKENKILPGFHFDLIERKVNPDDNRFNENNTAQTDAYRLTTINYTSDLHPYYVFQIGFDALIRLVILQKILSKVGSTELPLQVFLANITILTQRRDRLNSVLLTEPANRSEDHREFLSDKKNQEVRGDRELTNEALAFFETLGKGGAEKRTDALRLANNLRRSNQLFATIDVENKNGRNNTFDPKPIIVYEHDFLQGTEQKFRASNHFMIHATKYLIDFGSDAVLWGVERFEMTKKNPTATNEALLRTKTYLPASEILKNSDYRLTVESDHVYMGLPSNEQAQGNHEKFFQFAFGPQAMRYLMAYVVDNKNAFPEKLKQFLLDMASDVELLRFDGAWIDEQQYKLFEKPFIPRYLHKQETNLEELKAKIESRIKHIENEWDYASTNEAYLKRAEKNKLIMDAYRLFDWDGSKFFRANEYNQMSVCHYSLHLKNNGEEIMKEKKSRNVRHHGSKPNKFDYLFSKLFNLGNRKPPIPPKIIELIQAAGSLAELMNIVFAECRPILKQWLVEAENPMAETQVIIKICRKLGISIPAPLLEQNDKLAQKEAHAKTLQVQPIAVHPMLVVKYFFYEIYQIGKTLELQVDRNGKNIRKRAALPVFTNLRKNKSLRQRLISYFYDEEIANLLYAGTTEIQNKRRNQLIGLINTTCTEDILLWWIANKYLKNNPYTASMGKLLQSSRSLNSGGLGELHKLTVTLRLKGDSAGFDYYVSIPIHRLDDLIFTLHKEDLWKAAHHFIQRCTSEQSLWNVQLESVAKNLCPGGKLPTGTREQPIPFSILVNEIDFVRRTGHRIGEHLLTFETNVLNRRLMTHIDKNDFHSWLIQQHSKTLYSKVYPVVYFNFESVLSLAAEIGLPVDETVSRKISEYRNIAFHNDVPVKGSFSWFTRTGETIRELLSIKTNVHEKKDRSIYILKEGDQSA